MALFTKINGYVEHLHEGNHDFSSDQLFVALSNTEPTADGVQASTAAAVLATVTEIAYTNLPVQNSRRITTTSSGQTNGTYRLVLEDLTVRAIGGVPPAFQYVYIVNENSSPATNALIGYYDYGDELVLEDGQALIINFDAVNGLFSNA